MEKTYYLYTDLTMDDITYFITEIFQSGISFEYEYEVGTITIKNVSERLIDNIDEFIRDNNLEIHDTEEEF